MANWIHFQGGPYDGAIAIDSDPSNVDHRQLFARKFISETKGSRGTGVDLPDNVGRYVVLERRIEGREQTLAATFIPGANARYRVQGTFPLWCVRVGDNLLSIGGKFDRVNVSEGIPLLQSRERAYEWLDHLTQFDDRSVETIENPAALVRVLDAATEQGCDWVLWNLHVGDKGGQTQLISELRSMHAAEDSAKE
jgi:hypothetical protein